MTGTPSPDQQGRWYEEFLPDFARPGSEGWRWAVLLANSLRMVLGVSCLVAGTGLVGMGVVLCLRGVGLIDLNISGVPHEALAAGLAIAMIGSAATGLVVETAFRSAALRTDAAPWETTVSCLPALVLSLWILEVLEGFAARLLPRFSEILTLVPSYLNEVGNQGLLAGLAGILLMGMVLQFGAQYHPLIGENAPALIYACWMALVIFGYRPPGL